MERKDRRRKFGPVVSGRTRIINNTQEVLCCMKTSLTFTPQRAQRSNRLEPSVAFWRGGWIMNLGTRWTEDVQNNCGLPVKAAEMRSLCWEEEGSVATS